MLTTLLIIIQLGILVWGVSEYIRLRRQMGNIIKRVTMNIDNVIDEMLSETESDSATPPETHHRERIAALAAGGRAKQYLGKSLSVDQVDNMNDEEVEKLYSRYEAQLGAAMTKTLGAAVLQLYTSVASLFLPIPPEEQPKLLAELEADPFVEHAVSTSTCELYHHFGMYLAPMTTALTTLRHCQFGDRHRQSIDSCDGSDGASNSRCDDVTGESDTG